MAKNEREIRTNEGYFTLYKEGLTNKESGAALAKARASNKKARRFPDKRVGMWLPNIGRENYAVYIQTPRRDL
jgi:hypothetical protein